MNLLNMSLPNSRKSVGIENLTLAHVSLSVLSHFEEELAGEFADLLLWRKIITLWPASQMLPPRMSAKDDFINTRCSLISQHRKISFTAHRANNRPS